MWNREMVQRKKRLRICNRGGWGRLHLPISPRLKWKDFKRLSGKQPVQFEVGADEKWQGNCSEYCPSYNRGRSVRANKF